MTGRTLPRQETKRTVSGSFVLSTAVEMHRDKPWIEWQSCRGEGRVKRVTRKNIIFVSAALTCVSQRARKDGLAVDAYLTVTANRN